MTCLFLRPKSNFSVISVSSVAENGRDNENTPMESLGVYEAEFLP